jgi:hypothetical protein
MRGGTAAVLNQLSKLNRSTPARKAEGNYLAQILKQQAHKTRLANRPESYKRIQKQLELSTADLAPFWNRQDTQELFARTPDGTRLEGMEFACALRLCRRHPFFSEWVNQKKGQSVQAIQVSSFKANNGTMVKRFVLIVGKQKYEVNASLCHGRVAENRVRLYTLACLHALDKSSLRKKALEALGKIDPALQIDIHTLAHDFAERNGLHVKSAMCLRDLVSRNESGKWVLCDENLSKAFIAFSLKGIATGKYLKAKKLVDDISSED